MDISGKVALVTGGAVRVGRAISLGLAEQGVKVAVHYNMSDDAASQTVADVRASGGQALALQGDFYDISQIENVVSRSYREMGGLDFLINSAAQYFETPLGRATKRDWDQLLDLNLRAPFFCAQSVAAIMKEQGHGKIISIADVAGISPWPNFIPYCASKAGLISVTKGLAQALAPDIQVNAIASGTVLMQENASDAHEAKVISKTLLKRIGDPSDIVKTVIFLLRDADYITGEVIAVDGGRLLA